MSIQHGRDAFGYRGDFDFYRRRATWLRAQAIRDNATLKSLGISLLLVAAFCAASIALAATVSLLHGLKGRPAASQSQTPTR
jgi:hypothetical protein